MNILNLENTKDRHLATILRRQADKNGDTVFLISDDQRLTFEQVNNNCDRIAAGLATLGVEHSDRVALFMGNCPEMVQICLGVNKLGAAWVPICTDYKGEWLQDAITRSRPKVLVTDANHYQVLRPIASQLDVERWVILESGVAKEQSVTSYDELLKKTSSDHEVAAGKLHYGDTCAILWTSGTTGKSKGVMVAHNNWVRATAGGTAKLFSCQQGEVIYSAMPLYNAGGWTANVLRALINGVSVVIEGKFSVSQFMPRIREFGATQTFAVGSMGVFLMQQPELADDADNPLREAGIVPMPPSMWESFEQRFAVKLVSSGFGQSECLFSLNHGYSEQTAPPYALGWPPPDLEVRLFDDQGTEVADGDVGEICIKQLQPYCLFNGYFDNRRATENTYRGDWFKTGDMARKDPQTGAFYYVDRKKDAVRFAGRNISTMEVESVVLKHPDVQQAAAFGIPSEQLSSEDELKINVVVSEGADITAERLCQFINDNAPYYFVPRYLDFVTSLPMTPTNKVQKYKLREAGVGESTWDLRQSDFEIKR